MISVNVCQTTMATHTFLVILSVKQIPSVHQINFVGEICA